MIISLICINMSDKPYIEKKIDKNKYIRKFDPNISQLELEWHLDKQDRFVEVIDNDGGWQFQLENELPNTLKNSVFIPKETYHRLIKGSGNLVLKITNL